MIITGGFSGIGLAIAGEFMKQQAIVIIIAMSTVKLEKAKLQLEAVSGHAPVLAISADVSGRINMEEVIDHVGQQYGRVDVLLNCAGYINCGRFTEQSAGAIEQCLLINYMGAVNASKAVWEWLRKSQGQLALFPAWQAIWG